LKHVLSLLVVVSLGALAVAEPPTIERTGRIPLANAKKAIEHHRKSGENFPDPIGEVLLYRVRYDSVGLDQRPIRLSGLLAMPSSGAPKGIVLYFHGTTADRRLSPSRYGHNQPSPEAETACLAFACGGYALLMPDYLGLGDDPGIHPYPWASDNVASGVDLLRAVRQDRTVPPIGAPLFVTGYSEGGAVAMAAVRQLEQSGGEVPTRSAPMSGPYDLSGVTVNSMLRGRLAAFPLSLKLFFLSYAAYSTAKLHPKIELRDYFAPSFASYIPYLFGKGWPDSEVSSRLLMKAWQLGAIQSVHKVLTWRFRQALKYDDQSDPILRELRRHDVYDWAPKSPMLMIYLPSDSVVVPENTFRAVAAMRARAIGTDVVVAYALSGSGLTHITAAARAMAAARRFFDGGFGAVR
jgi:hypothetical protein